MHEPPASLEPQEEAEVLDRGIGILEGITGQAASGLPLPVLGLDPPLARVSGGA